ncbi:MAG: hypothetical protein A3G34_11365 [Candidatus Lindowbacteria bacterium RIFCSPLOWO2_12_FULL_62_27]|nr:MAG: hypothetical protein A3I06_16365 [Candidatus Lindowbacteria bacterium RIFCSPLOWO2_02_FULL_62_12]OGH60742.1 MAG: hypothetical protein A3G34_11365 [Candidatus Lindowbacteria bacterium RIFCSPLOWO2_12_FULL_62_27]
MDRKIVDFIHQSLSEEVGEEQFNGLAVELFAHQFAQNTPYRMFCMLRRTTPAQVSSWEKIPAAPTTAFRAAVLASFSPAKTVRVFETSGTTTGKPGKHHLDTLMLYDESAIPNFGRHVLPDGASLPMRILLPTIEEAPHSSLVYMCRIAADAFAVNAEWYIHDRKLNVDALVEDLGLSVETGDPRILMGPAFAFVHLFDALAEKQIKFALPAGSRIMETGGYKGKSREVTRERFYELARDILGIPPAWVVNEYGMTELSSQIYDDSLRTLIQTGSAGPAVKVPPPWVRVRIIDPVTDEPAAPGVPGLIRVTDLANRGSVVSIQTEDIGVQEGGGFRIIGRAKGADPRGCSLLIDEMLPK